MQRILIDSRTQLSTLVQEAMRAPRIAVDLESDGLFRYRPQLCTLQIAVGDTLAVIDTLALEAQAELQALLGPEGPLKVIHDVSFDARLLRRYDLTLGRVFDTALAARLLGAAGTGLSTLLAERCQVQVNKELQQHDWGQRPLSVQALGYLYDDVAHLFALHDSLQRDVSAKNIDAELEVEIQYTLEQVEQEQQGLTRPPWLRVKGAQALPAHEQAVLRALCELREQVAQAQNVPPFRVLHDRTLLQLAHTRPRSGSSLQRGPTRLPKAAQPLIAAILDAMERGAADPAASERDLSTLPTAPSSAERNLRRRLEKALSSWRKAEAERRNVDPQVILSGHALHALSQARPTDHAGLRSVRGLGECRIERYGQAWLSLIREQQT